jgi:hypothetical protein
MISTFTPLANGGKLNGIADPPRLIVLLCLAAPRRAPGGNAHPAAGANANTTLSFEYGIVFSNCEPSGITFSVGGNFRHGKAPGLASSPAGIQIPQTHLFDAVFFPGKLIF